VLATERVGTRLASCLARSVTEACPCRGADMSKPILCLVLVASLCACSLVGCSDDESSEDDLVEIDGTSDTVAPDQTDLLDVPTDLLPDAPDTMPDGTDSDGSTDTQPDVPTLNGEHCANGVDDDGDMDVDCNDPDCVGTPPCADEICDNTTDDDGDGLADCDDLECATATHCLIELCTNGKDDDGDMDAD